MKKHPIIIALITVCVLLVLFFTFTFMISTFISKKDLIGPDKIAQINIEGVITSSKSVIRQLHKYRDNPTVKAIVLRINSPGGGVAPAQEIYEEVNKIKKDKKIVVSMSSVAASGGYYIACAADKIFANPGTITGSIGVIMQLSNIEELMEKVGIKAITIKSGKYKDLGSAVREMTEQERKLLQKVIDDIYNQFVTAVAQGRNLEIKDIKPIADGRIFSGKEAKELNLIDELGNLQDAIAEAAKMAKIEGKPKVIYEKEKRSILDILDSKFLKKITSEALNNQTANIQYLWAY